MEPSISSYVANVRASDYDPTAQPWVAQNNLVRTSRSRSRFEGRFFYGLNTDFWQAAKDVNGSRTYNSAQNGVEIGVAGAVGDAYYDITKSIFFYQPDTVVHAATALVLGTDPTLSRFWGMASYQGGQIVDGFLLRNRGGSIEFVRVSSNSGTPVEEILPRSQWQDPLDGSGVSGLRLDFNSIQMAEINFAWYGAGTAFLNFRVDGKNYVAAWFSGANNGRIDPIIANPCLSVIYGIEVLTATTAKSARHWGLSVSVDGGDEETGRPFGVISGPKVVSGGAWVPVLSIRLKNLFAINGATPKPNLYGYISKLFALVYSSGRDSEIALVRKAVLTGAVWAEIPDIMGNPVTDSMVQYDTTATAFTGGIIAYPQPVTNGSEARIEVLSQDVISVDSLNTEQSVLTIAARPTAGGNATISAAWDWREIY